MGGRGEGGRRESESTPLVFLHILPSNALFAISWAFCLLTLSLEFLHVLGYDQAMRAFAPGYFFPLFWSLPCCATFARSVHLSVLQSSWFLSHLGNTPSPSPACFSHLVYKQINTSSKPRAVLTWGVGWQHRCKHILCKILKHGVLRVLLNGWLQALGSLLIADISVKE